jgi:AcrR family transcriptional regulator
MTTATRKQREVQQRETQILGVARQMLGSAGYLKLNMDRIASAVEYSKGTVYQHFDNKEDILVALEIQMLRSQAELFARASTYPGRPRERFAAVGVASLVHNRLYPEHLQIDHIICNPAIFEKARPDRQETLRLCEGNCMKILVGIYQDAIDAGDLELEEEMTPEECCFGPWALSTGAYVIMQAGIPLVEKGIREPISALWTNMQKLLDGYGWLPLSTEHDYGEVVRRAREELFAKEIAEIGDLPEF